jgi:hypothetical protein
MSLGNGSKGSVVDRIKEMEDKRNRRRIKIEEERE